LEATMNERQRVAMVTGGSRGIGFACARRLAERHCHVIVVDLEAAAEAAAEIVGDGGSAEARHCDLGEAGAVAELAAAVVEELGGCDVLVNNVAHGGGARVAFADHDRALWQRTFAVNFDAAVQLTTAFLPGMGERRFGRVINVVSNTLFSPPPIGIVAYVASKGALLGFTRALAKEVGATGVTVNAVAPGLVLSRPEDNVPHDEAFYREIADSQSIPRTLVPADIAGAVSFLASDDAALMTGQTLCVDGGFVML
jgi:NAD(P)-dependent dehydrogenase (short-subunit alcohol dehydrogenase family)